MVLLRKILVQQSTFLITGTAKNKESLSLQLQILNRLAHAKNLSLEKAAKFMLEKAKTTMRCIIIIK
tara:strand:+ start:761 stop:961 length:201 start_codon:yes stop_codon:yes gene_type:complete